MKLVLLCIFIIMFSLIHSEILINEVDSDTPGSDVLEFIELYDGGVGNTSLNGYIVVLFNGNGDVSYRTIDLVGHFTDINGFFLIGNPGVFPIPSITFPNGTLQNGADAIALYQDSAFNFPNGTAITTTNLIDALVYDTGQADDVGLLPLINAGQPQINEDQGGNEDTESMQRRPNGSGGARNTHTYVTASPTPGSDNPLPVTLASFTATLMYNEYISIIWTTHSESNLSHYNIYRNEIQLGSLNATNTTTTMTYQFLDPDIEDDADYSYTLEAVELDGSTHQYGPYNVHIDLEEEDIQPPDLPDYTGFMSNYPNPFNPATTISFITTSSMKNAQLIIYNTKGQVVKDLTSELSTATTLNLDGETVGIPGSTVNYNVNWDGRNDQGNEVQSGIYFYKLQTGDFVQSRKMVLMK